MTDKDISIEEMTAFFEAARNEVPSPSDALMARIVADADTVQAKAVEVVDARPRQRWTTEFWRMIGGWPAFAGLATAVVAGVWLGVSPPQALLATTAPYLGQDAAGLMVDLSADEMFGLSEGTL